jgi:hypothetical protein
MPKLKPTAATARATSFTVAEVDHPLRPGEKVRVITARASGLDYLRHHGRLTDAEATAGEKFAALFEIASGPGVKSVDFGAVRVDCAKRSFGPGESSFKAMKKLMEVREKLGERAFFLLAQIAGKGRALSDVAAELAKLEGMGERASQAYTSERLREALHDLADHWGARGADHAPMRCEHLPGFGTA